MKKADFPTRDIRIKATGEIVIYKVKEDTQTEELALKMPDSGQIFLLVSLPPKKPSKKKEPAEKSDLLPKLREAFKAGKKKFTITGQVHEHKEFPLGLTVEEFEVVQEKG